MRGHLLEKNFLLCLSPLSPQTKKKEDDEHFANRLQMCGTFTKAKISVICAEHPLAQNSIYPNRKGFFLNLLIYT